MIKSPGTFISGIFFIIIGMVMLCVHGLIVGLGAEFGTGAITGIAFGIGAGALLFRCVAIQNFEKND